MDSLYVKLTPDGDVSINEPRDSETLFEAIEREVGGYVENLSGAQLRLRLSLMVPGINMMVNEDGKRLGLDANPIAAGVTAFPEIIVGNVVFVKEADVNGEPDIVGLSAVEAERIKFMLISSM